MLLTVIFAIAGFYFARLPGLMLGACLGLALDARSKGDEADLETVPQTSEDLGSEDVDASEVYSEEEERFFKSCFPLFAQLAKVDGPVSKPEIVAVDHIMRRVLMLDAESRKKAIKIFKETKASSRSFVQNLKLFNQQYAGRKAILLAMVESLFTIACADQKLNEQEEKLIQKACEIFGISHKEFFEIRSKYYESKPIDEISFGSRSAFEVIGCSSSDSVETLKKSYRKLIQQYHPDKLAAKDLPKGFDQLAAQKFQEIQQAFSEIKKIKGF